MGDFLYAIRSARKRPLASLTIILILGVGIGATTAVFSVVDGLLLEPLPYPEPDRLVRVWKNDITRGYPHTPLIYPEYVHWIEASESFESAALMWTSGAGTATLVLDAAPREVRSLAVPKHEKKRFHTCSSRYSSRALGRGDRTRADQAARARYWCPI